jgi:hypothetical protein
MCAAVGLKYSHRCFERGVQRNFSEPLRDNVDRMLLNADSAVSKAVASD